MTGLRKEDARIDECAQLSQPTVPMQTDKTNGKVEAGKCEYLGGAETLKNGTIQVKLKELWRENTMGKNS